MKFRILFFTVLYLVSCKKEIKSNGETTFWKYCGGEYYDDVIVLNNDKWSYRNDTIFCKGTPLATFELNHRVDNSYQLVLSDLKTNNDSFYCKK